MNISAVSKKNNLSNFLSNEQVQGLLFFLAVSLIGVVARPLLPVDETRYLSVAWEMWQSGHYLVPTLNGEIYSHKPPLLFWLINLIWSIFGVTEWSARLVGPMAGLMTIYLTSTLSRSLWPNNTKLARKASLIIATSGGFLVFASLTMFDALLTIGVLIAAIGLVKFAKEKNFKWLLLFSFGVAFGALSKGPVILVHVVPAVIIMPFLQPTLWGERKVIWFLSLTAGILIAVLMVAVWLVPALISGGPEYQEAVLWTQSAGRITNSFAHQRPIWVYLVFLPLLLWPWCWTPFVWNFNRLKKFIQNEHGLFCCLWTGIVLMLFSLISGKQPHYLVPMLPVFSIILASLYEEKEHGKIWLLPSVVLPIALLSAIILLLSGFIPIRNSELFISETGLISLLFIFSATLLFANFYNFKASKALILLAPVTLSTLLIAAYNPVHGLYDSSKIGQQLAQYEEAGVAIFGRKYHGEFNFTGRLTKPLDIILGKTQIIDWAKNHPGGAMVGVIGENAPDWKSSSQFNFRNRSYAIWIAPKVKL